MKHLAFLVLNVFTSVALFAQNATGGKLEIGLASGINMTSLHGKGFARYYDWHYSVPGMLQLRYSFTDKLSLVTAVAYESKGCKGINLKLVDPSGASLGAIYDFSFTYKYITLPILFRYTHTEGFPFFLNAGPYLGYMLSYTEEYKGITVDRTSDMKTMDFGFSAGAGVFYDLSDKWSITGEIRNNLGLSNVWKSDDVYKTQPFYPILKHNPIYTNSTNFLVGIHYKL